LTESALTESALIESALTEVKEGGSTAALFHFLFPFFPYTPALIRLASRPCMMTPKTRKGARHHS
jgi:hypothetical protein